MDGVELRELRSFIAIVAEVSFARLTSVPRCELTQHRQAAETPT
jgi:hypothetical protein